jgi:FKBP-type peptidyl-prolyl cis-trans isomerase SlyD
MTISANKVVSLEYELKDGEGEILDTTTGSEPLAYLHGANNIIPGLENALEGLAIGAETQVSIPPSEGYGEYLDDLILEVPRTQFPEDLELDLGLPIEARSEDGEVMLFVVTEIGTDTVTLDANHPLAGETLHFTVKIADIREATEGEIAQGHPND